MDDQYLKESLELFGPTVGAAPVPEELFSRFEGVLPSLLLGLWREVGLAGFNGGRLCLCDPVEWEPAVLAWTQSLDLNLGQDTFHCIARSAFGEMRLWGERTGLSLKVEPVHGMIFPAGAAAEEMGSDFDRNLQIEAMISNRTAGDLYDSSEKKMCDRAVKTHGALSPDTVYSFVPAVRWAAP